MQNPFDKLKRVVTAPGDYSRTTHVLTMIFAISLGIGVVLTSYESYTSSNFTGVLRILQSICLLTAMASLVPLGIRSIAFSSHTSIGRVAWKLTLLFFILPVVLGLLLCYIAHLLGFPVFSANGG